MQDLQDVGVDTNELTETSTTRFFRAWMEDWELEGMKDNDAVMEARLLEKYKGLAFFDPDDRKTYTVAKENLEFRRGRKDGGWYLICESNVVGDEAEPFSIELANELISATQQMADVEVIRVEE
jgi:hypothetical protein